MRRPGGLDQGRNREARIGRAAVVLGLPCELGEDPAAALGLAQQQRGVLGMRAVLGQIMRQLLRDHSDRRERAAQLVRCRRSQCADRRNALLAGERQLRRSHRVAQPPRLLCDAPGIAPDKNGREHQRDPDPQHQLGRKYKRLGAPGQRDVPQGEHRDRRHREDRERDNRAPRQDRRSDGHRREDQSRERVLQTAGQVQQDGELQDVVAEAQRGVSFAEAGRRLAHQDQHPVQQNRAGDDCEGRKKRQAIPEAVMHDQDGESPVRRSRPSGSGPVCAG